MEQNQSICGQKMLVRTLSGPSTTLPPLKSIEL